MMIKSTIDNIKLALKKLQLNDLDSPVVVSYLDNSEQDQSEIYRMRSIDVDNFFDNNKNIKSLHCEIFSIVQDKYSERYADSFFYKLYQDKIDNIIWYIVAITIYSLDRHKKDK